MSAIARACAAAGGRLLVVGGWVRDAVRAVPAAEAARTGSSVIHASIDLPEFDLEVYGLSPTDLERVLASFGSVRVVGKSFAVFRVGRLPIEVSLPRRTRALLPGEGSGRFDGFDPELSFAESALGRDLRVNAMGFDPLSGELLDPHGGTLDLAAARLSATSPERFGEDPLRGLRTAQLAARLELEPDAELLALCRGTDLGAVPGERSFAEFRKLLLLARRPSRGFELLRETELIRFFPELASLAGVGQDEHWHPEGDVWTHTLRVLDAAALERTGDARDDLALMFGALCHDLGKPATTSETQGRITAHGHSRAGIAPTERLLERLRAPNPLVVAVRALVVHHLSPRAFVRDVPAAGPRAYRRLARDLRAAGVGFDLLVRLARADARGGGAGLAPETGALEAFPDEALFLSRAREIDRDRGTHDDSVRGEHLLARGFAAGPRFGPLLARCRAVQDETGWVDPERILDRALATARDDGNPADESSGQ